ncbi:nucleotidyltransferase domain-containing protein [Streptomyces sp. WAC06614]|uniref:nucleotidyltransferase domain-containing protein n=1 Tax=Streptomyces sp. WAC06614 TaxID=2487416 RepID=UPI000F78D91A|nr:nucleotidyltransferase domain-containing protein [Streptomyces sp. WAC06614]RSS80471.1 nucleotidyltransferase domain-containing protein [Streptomyces sp. WAC06614]
MADDERQGRSGRRGLDARGWFEREGSLGRVQPAFAELVATARTRIAEAYGRRLHSAYLYGSVPRGTARPGRSDLDLLLVLHSAPTPEDRQTAEALAHGLDEDFAVADGVGVLLSGKDRLLSEQERHGLGWFLACLCTPLLGDDLAEHLPRYRPDSALARATNGDLGDVLPRWRERAAAAADDPQEVRRLRRAWARKLVRTGFTLVMPRWGGWTSDLAEAAEVFGQYYPQRAAQLRAAAADAQEPGTDPAVLRTYAEDLGPWLAAEHDRVHGRRTVPAPATGTVVSAGPG